MIVLPLLVACQSPVPSVQPRLVVEEAVLVVGDDLIVNTAQAAVSSEGQGEAQHVQARVESEGELPPLEIQAPNSTWDLQSRTAEFHGGVLASRGDVTLSCDSLSVVFSSPSQLDSAQAIGSVKVTHGLRHAEAAQAELNANTGELVLTGAPVLVDGVNKMAGERITLWLDDERVECHQCQLTVSGSAIQTQEP